MKSPITILSKFSKNCTGATAIEYGLIAALISVAILSAVNVYGDKLDKQLYELRSEQESK
ncbi:Flp family type IVb pilin [Candidatus Nomurabacteria bacterium]|nr:Flp family type IVb pilin [Candidatus Nomurabacteria bacterium]MCB9819260.1 Flp family type IVb pilin [Candidatus Nomurabacteria bacterium]